MKYLKLFENFGSSVFNKHYPKMGVSTEDVFKILTHVEPAFKHHGSIMSRNYKKPYPTYPDCPYGEPLYESEEEAYAAINRVLNKLQGPLDYIKVYRTIAVESEEDIWYDQIGDCWTYDRQSALDFGELHHHANCLLSGEVTHDMVDWESTIRLYFIYTIMKSAGTEENEIRLKSPSYQIDNLTIEWLD